MAPFSFKPDAGGFKSEAVDVGPAAGREHHLVDHDVLVVGQLDAEPAIHLFDRLDDLLGEDLDAALLQFGAQVIAHLVVKAAQDVVAAIDQRHLGAEPVEDAGKLDGDVAAALDQDALGQLLQMERLVRGDHMLAALDVLAERGPAAGGNQDMFRAHRLAGRDELDGVRIDDHRTALGDLDLGAIEIGGVGLLEPVDLLVLVGDQRRPIELRLGHRPAEARGILEFLGEARGIDQQLLRHAAADHAGAADPILLGDHHPRAIAGRDAGGTDPARTRADDEQIDLFRHSPCPA